jgi:hypothetical protein
MKTERTFYILQRNQGYGWYDISFRDDGETYRHEGDTPEDLINHVIAYGDFYTKEDFMRLLPSCKMLKIHAVVETTEVPLDDYKNILTKE